jgi:hypothetical protein
LSGTRNSELGRRNSEKGNQRNAERGAGIERGTREFGSQEARKPGIRSGKNAAFDEVPFSAFRVPRSEFG